MLQVTAQHATHNAPLHRGSIGVRSARVNLDSGGGHVQMIVLPESRFIHALSALRCRRRATHAWAAHVAPSPPSVTPSVTPCCTNHPTHLAMTKSSRTMRLPSPMYFCTSSLPLTRMNVQSVWCATARASSVLPVPGGPYSSTP
jgi:hypothetical protein